MAAHAGRRFEDVRCAHQVEVDPHTGTPTLTVPLRLPAARGLAPELALVHQSGAGPSPFGTGWCLSGLSSVTIDVRRRLPRWDGDDPVQLDGVELVPWLERTGDDWRPRGRETARHRVTFLRRRDGAPVRVERWQEKSSGRVHFVVRDGDGTTTYFGARASGASRVADPGHPWRTFAWLPELVTDRIGNAMWIEHVAEDTRGVDRVRGDLRPGATAQRYLKRIRYGNSAPLALDDDLVGGTMPDDVRWCFHVVLDYGDHDVERPRVEPDRDWTARGDPTSTFAPGFEVRTHRLCARVLQFHDVPELGPTPVLVGEWRLEHDADPAGARLRSIQEVGHRLGGPSRVVPPLRMTYAAPALEDAFEALPAESTVNLPAGLLDRTCSMVDLFGEGLPGLLTQVEGTWLWKPNLGGGRFGAQVTLAERPAARSGGFALGDHDSDGDTDLAQLVGRAAGWYELDRDAAAWRGFRPFASSPRVEALGGRAQWVDLDGDGRADVVVARPDGLLWFPSAVDGSDTPTLVPWPDGMPTTAADPSLGVLFADLNGDGLPDLVRVGNGRVEYWPNLGCGRFGIGVLLDDAPWFEASRPFDLARVRFVDLDGSGCADLLYLGDGEVRCWINAGGNRLIEGPRLGGLPFLDNVSAVQITDLLGDGRPCLTWSSPSPTAAAPLQYLPLAPAVRPRMLLTVDDSVGGETRLVWGHSAAHYLRDADEGRAWSSKLPGHGPVVDRLERVDQIAGTRAISRYAYHDGVYDGDERESRGFSHVDVFDAAGKVETDPGGAGFAAPALTRIWFHPGTALLTRPRPFDAYDDDALLPRVPAHEVNDPLDALRSAAGQELRREVFAVDAAGRRAPHPFSIEQRGVRLVELQPGGGRARAVVRVDARESVTAIYDQQAADPRVEAEVVVEVDAWGTPVREAHVAYPRRPGATLDHPAQGRLLVTVHDRELVHIDEDERFELMVPVGGRDVELLGFAAPPLGRVTPSDLQAAAVVAALEAAAPHGAVGTDGLVARILSWEHSLYWDDARAAPLPLGVVGSPILVHHEEAAVLGVPFVATTLGARADDARLAALGYVLRDEHWWQVDDVQVFAPPERFHRPETIRHRDGTQTTTAWDAHGLAAVATSDPLGNTTTFEIDYHVVAPWRTTDPNGLVAEVLHDALGVVVVETQRGQVAGQPWGMAPLSQHVHREPAATSDVVGSALADPHAHLQGASRVTYYDADAWWQRGRPPTAVTLAHEELRADGEGGGTVDGRVAASVVHLDGFGRVLQSKALVDPGLAIQRGADGAVMVDDAGAPVVAHTDSRWRSSGHVIHDAKQRPARVYEPYFTATWGYESDAVLERFGVSTLSLFDALGRVVRRDFPNGTFELERHGPWSSEHADANDTIDDSTYRALRELRPADDPERRAYEHARPHHGTSTVTYLDPRGRPVASLARGGTTDDRRSSLELDAAGRPTQVVDPRGIVAFVYHRDLAGREVLVESVDAGNHRALHDADGRLALEWDARGYEVVHTHDRAGRPRSVHVRGNGIDAVVNEWTYGDDLDPAEARARNLLGRPLAVRDQSGESAVAQYDPTGVELASSRRLRVATARSAGDAVDWRTPPALSEAFSATARHDALGRVREETLADGSVRRYRYSADGSATEIRLTTPDGRLVDVPIVAGSAHDASGRRQRTMLGNGVEVEYAHDRETGRLAAQRASRGGRRYQDIAYTHDPVGNLIRIHDRAQLISGTTAPARRDCAYDAHYRLVSATGRVHQALLQRDHIPGAGDTIKGTRHLSLNNGAALERCTRTYTYDPSGNLLALRHVGASRSWTTVMTVLSGSNRAVPSVDDNGVPVDEVTAAARFDAAGNLLALGHLRELRWSWRGKLARAVVIARASGVDDSEGYAYGADGERAIKVAERVVHGGQVETTEKLYLGDAERLRVVRDGTVILERWTVHVSDGDARVALVHRWTVDVHGRETDDLPRPRVAYQLTTHQGSTALELDADGGIISYEEYFPYGGTAFIAGDQARDVSRRDVRFMGKERDDATGLYDYGQRYYAPWIGRWLSPDPIGPEDDLNLYQFVLGDPVGNVDEDGLETRGGNVRRTYADMRVDAKDPVGSYRGHLNAAQTAGFAQLSSSDQHRLATTASAWFVPQDPHRATEGQRWVILDREHYADWLHERRQWASEQRVDLNQIIHSLNQPFDAAAGGGGGAETLSDADRELLAMAEGAPVIVDGDAPRSSVGGKATSSGAGRGAGAANSKGKGGEGTGGGTGVGSGAGTGTGEDSIIAGVRGGVVGGVVGGTPGSIDGFMHGGVGTGSAMGRGASPVGNATGAHGEGHGSEGGLGDKRGPGAATGAGEPGGSGTAGAQDGTAPASGQEDTRARPPDAYRSPNARPGNAWDLAQSAIGAANLEFSARGGHPDGAPGSIGSYTPRGWTGKVIHALWAVTGIISAISLWTLGGRLIKGLIGFINGARNLGPRGLLHLLRRFPGAAVAAVKAAPGRVASAVSATARRAAANALKLRSAASRLVNTLRYAWNGLIARWRGGVVADTNVLISLAAGDAQAVAFATRNAGRLYVNERIVAEFVEDMGTESYRRLAKEYGIRRLSMSEPHARSMMSRVGVTSEARLADFEILGTADLHGLSIATGDTRLVTAALRSGMTAPGQVIARIFERGAAERVQWYRKIRDAVKQWAPDLDPHTVTGSRTR